ncbi:Hypothetical predicted protein [Paramuricea clavata]|uniref:Uncharacterized protein n=1 Tax=Paramuricea clavata TaxID=317549 RepID=A0A6S7JCN1_PARCT|nr:Hypothetical predicted protein [Paramuricea clavata]
MKQRRSKYTVNMKTYNQQILKHCQDESNTSFIKGKEIFTSNRNLRACTERRQM